MEKNCQHYKVKHMSISVSMIANLTVGRNSYSERCPEHTYEITLTDGRSRQGEATSLKVRSLIKAISEEKITYLGSTTRAEFEKSRVRGARLGIVKTPLPESVLAEIFSQE